MKDQHPLVCHFGSLNDMIMLTPLIKHLNTRSGHTVDVITTGEWTKILFEHMPYIRHITTIESLKTPYFFSSSQKNLVAWMKATQHQNAWLCTDNNKLNRLLKRGGISSEMITSPTTSPQHSDEHCVDYWLRLASSSPNHCNYQTLSHQPDEDTELVVTNYETEVCKNWLSTRGINDKYPIICIQAGHSTAALTRNTKRTVSNHYWDDANWVGVLDTIIQTKPDAQILLCGSSAERAHTMTVKALCKQPNKIFSVTADLPLRRLMALLSISHSCISVNTGTAHIAAAVNCPLTVLTDKTDARIFSPFSRQTRVILIADGDTKPFLTVERVINGWESSVS